MLTAWFPLRIRSDCGRGLVGLALLALTTHPIRAQDRAGASTPTAPPWQGWLAGAHVAVPAGANQVQAHNLSLGVQLTQLRPGRPGLDAAVGLVPNALTANVLALQLRGGVGMPVPLSRRVVLVPVAGVSVASATGAGGADAQVGWHGGASVAVVGAGAWGVRSGVTVQRLGGAPRERWVLDLGVVRRPRVH